MRRGKYILVLSQGCFLSSDSKWIPRHGNLMFGAALLGPRDSANKLTDIYNEEKRSSCTIRAHVETMAYYAFRAALDQLYPDSKHLYPEYTPLQGPARRMTITSSSSLIQAQKAIVADRQAFPTKHTRVNLVKKKISRGPAIQRSVVKTAFSVEANTSDAINASVSELYDQLGGKPDFLLCVVTSKHDASEVTSALCAKCPKDTLVAGCTSCHGVFTEKGTRPYFMYHRSYPAQRRRSPLQSDLSLLPMCYFFGDSV